jgi:TetR/AcrR family transcriptional repressor of nem operon
MLPTMVTARDKLVTAAQGLMLTQGYQPTSVDEIIAKAGVSKGSFYHYFRSKEELGSAVAEQYLEQAVAALGQGRYQEIEDPIERGFAFVEHLESASTRLWTHGCMLGSFAIDLAATHPEIATCLDQLMSRLEARMEPMLKPIANACAQQDAPSGRELANHLMAVIEGGIVMAKAHSDPTRVAKAIHEFRRYLKALLV